jgi:SAM-dependent methyltransferase
MQHSRPTSPPRSAANRLRHVFGLRQWFFVEGVRYRELTSDSMRRALSRKGPGFKDYEVLFPDGASMQIRASADRIFADLAGADRFAVYSRAEQLLLPGMRILILGGGTGYAGNWAAARVAPSGAVVSLEVDAQSVEYARRRYRTPNVSFETGGIAELAGEIDGSFNAAVVILPDPRPDPAPMLAECWRLVAPGGWLLAVAPAGAHGDFLLDVASSTCRADGRGTVSLLDRSADWTSAVYRRPAEDAEPRAPR